MSTRTPALAGTTRPEHRQPVDPGEGRDTGRPTPTTLEDDRLRAVRASFNLCTEPWIPVLSNGRRTEVSLLQALTQSGQISALSEEEPLEAIAILRQVLLPVLLDALGPPTSEEEWVSRWRGERPDADALARYLEDHAERFDLFDETRPFAQVGGLRALNGETKPVSVLLPAIATGNNVPLFSAWVDSDPPTLSPSQAARALLAAQCWDTAAIKSGAVGDPEARAGKTTGNPTGPVGQLGVVVPVGRNLGETLALNTPIMVSGSSSGDRPQWRAIPPTAAWSRRPAHGILDLLTWQARRIRLIPEQASGGSIVVRQVVLAGGDRLDPLPVDAEPHTCWHQAKVPKAGRPPVLPLRHAPGRAAWRGMTALLARASSSTASEWTTSLLDQLARLGGDGYLEEEIPLQVLTVGVAYGKKSAVIDDVLVDRIPLPLRALREGTTVRALLLEVVSQAEQLRQAANLLSNDLRQAAGGEAMPRSQGGLLGEVLVHGLGGIVMRMLAGLQRQPDRMGEADAAWRAAAWRLALEVAQPVLESVPPATFLGRKGRGPTAQHTYRASRAEATYRATITRILGPQVGTPTSRSRQGASR